MAPGKNKTMYETIMSTPIFKGLSHNDISMILERIPFNLTTVSKGSCVTSYDQPADSVKFILSGEATAFHRAGSLEISERFNCERAIDAERLFGYHHNSDIKVIANSNLAVMTCGKQDFIKMLHSQRILMINYLNYLSIRAQRPADCLLYSGENTLRSYISFLLKMLCDRSSMQFIVHASEQQLSLQTNLSTDTIHESINLMETTGKILISHHDIIIVDRDYFDFL